MHDSICRLQADHPKIVVLAYLDDVFILGKESPALSAFDALRSSFSVIHLDVSDEKCEIFSPLSPDGLSSLFRRSDGAVFLGFSVG